ncbi:MAG: outer membrane beta-barrel protein [Minicystis sp.]
MKTIIPLATGLLALALPAIAAAQPAPPDKPAPAQPVTEAPAKPDRGAFVAGAKLGVALPFDGLGPMASGVVEVGYVFPWLKRSFGLLVDVAYTVPIKSGTQMGDPRVDGTYGWKLTQKELTISPAAYYRLTLLGRVVPYVGIGPRIYLHQSVVEGNVGKEMILATKEQSTKVGVGVPVGVGVRLGPGELTGEFLFEWGKLDHTATGDSTSLAGNFQVGYRFLL